MLSSHIQSFVQLLKKLISPKGNFFHVDKANEKVKLKKFMASFMKNFIMDIVLIALI